MTGSATGRPGRDRYLYHDGCLAVDCWCRERVVRVPADEVRRGLTRPCRRDACIAQDEAARR